MISLSFKLDHRSVLGVLSGCHRKRTLRRRQWNERGASAKGHA